VAFGAAVNMKGNTEISSKILISFALLVYPEVGLLDHMVALVLIF
jgi:hypothetical protein